MKLYSLILGFLLTLLFACKEEPKDLTQEINKDGAIETEITVSHLDANYDIIQTKHKTWVRGNNNKEIIHTDTIASLGMKTEEAFNEDDESKQVTIPKDYEIFITVK
jgi:hypothetical protein